MRRNDPYTRIQRQQLSTLSITLPLLTVVAIVQSFNPHNDLFVKVGFLVLDAILLLAGVFAIFRYRSNLNRLEQRRERALQGDSSLLAREQPLADPNILPLPTTIKLDQSRRAVVFLGLIITFVVFIPLGLFISLVIGIVVGSSQNQSPGNHALLE